MEQLRNPDQYEIEVRDSPTGDVVTGDQVWPERWKSARANGLPQAVDTACNFLEDALRLEIHRATRIAICVGLEDEQLTADLVPEAARLLCKDVRLIRDVSINTLAAAHLVSAYEKHGPPIPGKHYTQEEVNTYRQKYPDVEWGKTRHGYVAKESSPNQ